MNIDDFKTEVEGELRDILSSEFKIMISDTMFVPNSDDQGITFSDTKAMQQKCKLLETCVLFIDIRKSTDLNLKHRPETMAKLYSAFIRSMIKAGTFYGGTVRNIIGDRIMVVFDSINCYKNAVNTAVLMNSVSKFILNKYFKHNEVSCGIGIDYGEMLVTKAGVIKQGSENKEYKSLVWLGRPANIASKLTDLANKLSVEDTVSIAYPGINGSWFWVDDIPLKQFVDDLEMGLSPIIRHKDPNFLSFVKGSTITGFSSEILMTEEVYLGFKSEAPNDNSITENMWSVNSHLNVEGYKGRIYGGNIHFLHFT